MLWKRLHTGHLTVVARVCQATGSRKVGMPNRVVRQHALNTFFGPKIVSESEICRI